MTLFKLHFCFSRVWGIHFFIIPINKVERDIFIFYYGVYFIYLINFLFWGGDWVFSEDGRADGQTVWVVVVE